MNTRCNEELIEQAKTLASTIEALPRPYSPQIDRIRHLANEMLIRITGFVA